MIHKNMERVEEISRMNLRDMMIKYDLINKSDLYIWVRIDDVIFVLRFSDP